MPDNALEAQPLTDAQFRTTIKLPNGATITTFAPPPADFDPITADQMTLRRHGYPRRPDDPVLLERWKQVLGTPMRHVQPKIVWREHTRRGKPALKAATESWDNWCGGVVYAGVQSAFYWATGQWKVPNIKSPHSDGVTYCAAVWVGIDGDGTSDLLQAGIECEVTTNGGVSRNMYAWIEWVPADAATFNYDDFPVDIGDTITCIVNSAEDCLPGHRVNAGQWQTIDGSHKLLAMHDGLVLDCDEDGNWRLWEYKATHPGDCLPVEVASGQWMSVKGWEGMVVMPDGYLLVWDDQGNWRLFEYNAKHPGSCLAGTVASGKWDTIDLNHSLVPMPDGRLLDWTPDGNWRLWDYKATNPKNCLVGMVNHGKWVGIDANHTLLAMPDGSVLDKRSDGVWRLLTYKATNKGDCSLGGDVAAGQWQTIDGSHTLVPMHDGRVLDWDTDGNWRVWNYAFYGRSAVAGTLILRNETKKVHVSTQVTAPDGGWLEGASGEWIVERPMFDELSQLADFGTLEFKSAWLMATVDQTITPIMGNNIDMTDDHHHVTATASANGETVTCKYV